MLCIIGIEACAVQLPLFVNIAVLRSVRGDGFANSALRRKLTGSSLSVHFISLYCRLKQSDELFCKCEFRRKSRAPDVSSLTDPQRLRLLYGCAVLEKSA